MWGAEAINAPRGTKTEFGIVRPGMLADLVFVDENPYVMKDGILYDAKKLLRDVEVMVQQAKATEAKK